MAKVQADVFEFDTPELAEAFTSGCEFCKTEVTKIYESYGLSVSYERLEADEGISIIGRYPNGEEILTVVLDPFEVPVMKTAFTRGRLKEYILAANSVTDAIVKENFDKNS